MRTEGGIDDRLDHTGQEVEVLRTPLVGQVFRGPFLPGVGDADLVTSGVMIDDTMVYWYARPSVTYRTVAVRVGDVCLTTDHTVLVAALVRALFAMIDDQQAGTPMPLARDCVHLSCRWGR
jgi:hypothetical protein